MKFDFTIWPAAFIADLRELTDRQTYEQEPLCAVYMELIPTSDTESLWLTLSSQLQPRSSVPKDPTPEPTGLETSSGMAGRWVGALSRWFRLPWVPLLGAGFRPSRSGRD